MLGHTSRADRGQRHAPRQLEPATAGQLRRGARHVSRSAQRLPVLGVAGRRLSTTSRSATSARSTWTGTPSVEAKVGRFEGGWIAEIAIPFKSLRYSPGASRSGASTSGGPIRVEERALVPHAPVAAAWGGTSRSARFSAAATLVGLEAPPAAMNLEIKPYAIAGLTTDLLASRRTIERLRSRRRLRRQVRHHARASPPTSPTTPTSRRSRTTKRR